MHFGVHRYYAGCIILSFQSCISPMMKSLIGSSAMKSGIAVEFSSREWFGLLAGVGWGLCLGYFFKSGNMTGPWLVILVGPPVVLLISPTRPILSWQVPIVTAIAFGTIVWRSRDETAGDLLGAGLLTWLICTLFSSPWALIFRERMEQARGEKNREPGILASYLVLGILVFLACALIILGFVLGLYQVSPTEGGSALYSFLMVTGGVGVSIVSYQLGRKCGVSKPVRQVLDMILGLGSIGGTVPLIVTAYFAFQQSVNANRFGLSDIYSVLAVLETIATIIWLGKAAKLEKNNSGNTD